MSLLGVGYWAVAIAFLAHAAGSLYAGRPLVTTKKYAERVDYRWFSGSQALLGFAFIFVGISVRTRSTMIFVFIAAGLMVSAMCAQVVAERLPRRRLPSQRAR